MINNIKSSFVLFALLLGSFSSCTDEINVKQFDDLEVTPTFESSILSIEIEEFIINLSQSLGGSISQIFNFEAFSENLFAKRVISGVITYEIENTTSKSLTISFDFLDENEAVLAIGEVFNISPGDFKTFETSYGPEIGDKSLEDLIRTTKVRFNATNNGDFVSVNQPDSKIVLKSKGVFKVRLK